MVGNCVPGDTEGVAIADVATSVAVGAAVARLTMLNRTQASLNVPLWTKSASRNV
jgi:hypothetical protein